MPRSFARTALLVLAALVPAACAQAGEPARPVPDNAQVTRFTRFNIRYSVRDIVADGVMKVDFYITDDMGGAWRHYGEDPDRVSPMTVEVPGEGVYGFVVVVTDRNGNRERAPGPRSRPESVIIVDRTPPTAKWLAPRQDILGRGQGIEMQWESADDHLGDAPVTLQYAVNANGNYDRNANWLVAAEDLPATGTYSWTPPDSQRYNFRLLAEDRAGNIAVAYSAATVSIDNTPPAVRSVDPLRSNRLENDIRIDADDNAGGSGVKEYSLYYSEDNSATWSLLKEVSVGNESVPVKRAPGDAVRFTAGRSGEYPLWPVIFDNAGNATPLPSVAVAGPYILTIDTEPPVVTLSSSFLQGRLAVLSNEQRTVEWTSYDPHLAPNSATISLSLDNGENWQELRGMLSTSGSDYISFPLGAESEDAKLRVTVMDEFGNTGESVSEAFKLSGAETTIDSVTPRGGATQSADGLTGFGAGTPAIPAPTTPSTPADWFGTGTGAAPTDAGAGASAMPGMPGGSFPALGTPGGDIYGGTGLDVYGGAGDLYAPSVNLNESTASTIPQAALNAATPASPLSIPDQPGANAGFGAGGFGSGQSGMNEWTSSALPATPAAAAGTGDWVSSTPAPAAPAATAPVLPPPTGSMTGTDSFGTGGWVGSTTPAPAAPAFPATTTTVTPPPPATDPFAASGAVTPPPMATGDFPAFDQNAGGLSLDAFGATPTLPAPTETQTPAITTTPATPAPGLAALPDAGTATDPFSPPVLTPSQRPANPRLESNRQVDASEEYRRQGRPDLALDSARKAMEADQTNPAALMELAQVNARIDPPDFVTAANLAKEATALQADWETWWNCAEVFYLWAHAGNSEIQNLTRAGQTPPVSLVDERNSTLNNALIAIGNAAGVVSGAADATAAKKVSVTQGMIAYLRALTVPQPANTGDDDYRRRMAGYKATVSPLLTEALPFFSNALGMGGAPEYTETFQLGIINFRLAGLERDTGNTAQAGQYYQEAARYLEEATTAGDAPAGGPREAYYMLALSHEQIAELPDANRARSMELALRYWRQTADFYEPDSPYGVYARQRIDAISRDMGL